MMIKKENGFTLIEMIFSLITVKSVDLLRFCLWLRGIWRHMRAYGGTELESKLESKPFSLY